MAYKLEAMLIERKFVNERASIVNRYRLRGELSCVPGCSGSW
jgi:hypothetical protein